MNDKPFERMIRSLAVSAMIFGSLICSPQSAFSAWTVGTPIVTYWNAGDTMTLTESIAKQAVAGGYNLVWITDVSQLPIAERYGLRTLLYNPLVSIASVDNPALRPQIDALINQYRASPAAYGYWIADEPPATLFSDYARPVNYFRERDPDRMAYINLFGMSGPPNALGASSYADYIAQFVSTVHPAVLSTDYYPLLKTTDMHQYFENLDTLAKTARKASIPFINVTQGCAWDLTIWRVPSSNELRFLVYSTLAYGAQGISYFNYLTEQPNSGGIAPNADGTPTSVYTALTPLNREFTAIAKQYQSLKWLGTYLKGYRSDAMPPGTTTLPSDAPFNISSVSNDLSWSSGAAVKGVLLGLFGSDRTAVSDAAFALVANLDYSSGKCYTVTGPSDLSIFDATTGVWTPTGHNYATLNLAPGGGVLVGLTSAIPVPEPSSVTLLGLGVAIASIHGWQKCSRVTIGKYYRAIAGGHHQFSCRLLRYPISFGDRCGSKPSQNAPTSNRSALFIR
jgi:hypothetical protein